MATVPPSPQFNAPTLGEPAWSIALLYPGQGYWDEQEYLDIALSSNQLIEYSDGFVEVLPMPTIEHQLIVRFLLDVFRSFVEPRNLGIVLFAPLPVWTRDRQYREPDFIYQSAENHAKSNRKFYKGADLVVEVVSDDAQSQVRDYEKKLVDYARAGIPEYWIVDPQAGTISVMTLAGDKYDTRGVYKVGETASSQLLDGLHVNVSDVFAAGKR
jgi:Uma2 family endonuclease